MRNAWVEVVLNQGRNRQIRRLLGAVGADVLRLVRIDVGGVRLGDLPRGAVRHLSPAEKAMLDVPARAAPGLLRPPAGISLDGILTAKILGHLTSGPTGKHEPTIMLSFVSFRRGLHRAGNLIAGN